MKRSLFALSLALQLAAPAFAQDQVTILQQGNDHTVTINQQGNASGNQIKVEQGNASSNGGSVAVTQFQVGNSFAGVGDYGLANTYTVEQYQGENLIALINDGGGYGENNVGSIRQSGFDSEARLTQLGFGSWADITQYGGRNSAMIMQDGAANTASLTQSGNASAMIMQSGTGNRAAVTQGQGPVYTP